MVIDEYKHAARSRSIYGFGGGYDLNHDGSLDSEPSIPFHHRPIDDSSFPLGRWTVILGGENVGRRVRSYTRSVRADVSEAGARRDLAYDQLL